MYLTTVIVLAVLIGGFSLYLGFRILRSFSWFGAWLRGTSGLIFVALAVLVAFVAIDLGNYQELLEEKPIASLNFEKIAEQRYRVNVSYYIDREAESYELLGDQWQADARIIRWSGLLGALGAKPGFTLDRLSGRYYSLEDEHNKPRSVFSLKKENTYIDVWQLMQDNANRIPLAEAQYGSAAYLPMADKATFKVLLSHNGLTAVPVNDAAKASLQFWQ